MARNQKIRIQHYLSPCGELVLGSLGDKLCLCNWVKEKHPGRVDQRLQTGLKTGYEEGASDVVQEAIGQLEAYFRRERVAFDIPPADNRYRFPNACMACFAGNSIRADVFLRRTGNAYRVSQSGTRCG